MSKRRVPPIPEDVMVSKIKLAKILWKKVKELRELRQEAFQRHNTHRAEMLPYMSDLGRETSKGSPEAAGIAGQIEIIINLGKLLGLVDKSVDPLDYF